MDDIMDIAERIPEIEHPAPSPEIVRARKHPRKTKRRSKRSDLADIVIPILSGQKTQAEIAADFGVTRSAINQRLQRVKWLMDQDAADAFEQDKSVILSNAEARMIEAMVKDQCINKAPLSSISSSYKVLFDANRLVRGQSTSNISVHNQVHGLQEQLLALDAQIRAVEGAGEGEEGGGADGDELLPSHPQT